MSEDQHEYEDGRPARGLDDTTLGEMLRRAREQHGQSIHDLSSCLKLEPRTLEWLEQEAWDKLPPPAFIRGYLRAIAKNHGIDSAPLLAVFDLQVGGETPELSDFKSRAPIQITSESNVIRYTTIALCVALVVLVGLWWGTHRDAGLDIDALVEDEPPARVEPASEPLSYEFDQITHSDAPFYAAPAAAPPLVTADDAPTMDDGGFETATNNGDGASDEPAEDVAEAPAEPVVTPADEPAATADAGDADIVIQTTQDAWIDVSDSTGRRLYFDFARPGRTVSLTGKPPYTLVVGNLAAVKVLFRGKAVALEPYGREGVARFELGR